MIARFKYSGKITRSYGRNGLFLTTGVQVEDWYCYEPFHAGKGQDAIIIQGITSRDKTGTGYVCLPKSEIPKLIEILKNVKP